MDQPDTLDEAQLEQLYERLERRLYNAAFRYVWQQDDAVDVVQEAFMKLWEARDRVRKDGAEAYLWRIVLNIASKRRRWNRLRAFVGLDGLQASSRSPDERVAQAIEDRRVRDAVDALPEPQRRVLLMTEVSGLSHEEVAATLGVAVGTVASRRARAFAALREVLGDVEVTHA